MEVQQGDDERWEDEKGPAPERAAVDDSVAEKRSWIIDDLFPRLSANGGKLRCTRSRSVAILSALYCSHVFSAWGDRMWQFLVTLLLALLYPGSLLLPAVFGLVFAILPALLGTFLGDFVDRNPRMRVVWISLLVQNTLVCACSVALAVLFGLNMDICSDVPLYLFALLTAIVIVLGASGNLATVVNTIAVEKDWVVVIADKNKDILASLNANMRRIDLICKLLAPAAAGAILQFTGPLTTTIVVASWNVVSFFAELSLIWLVYRWVPALAVKKLRKSHAIETADEPLIEDAEEEEEEESALGEGEELKIFDEEKEKEENTQVKKIQAGSTASHPTWCSRLLAPMTSLRYGWSNYWRQEIALAGVSMAVIYLTVLGFSGVTATYFLTQGLPNSAIGAGQGAGALIGVAGTIAYPSIRRRVGTVRTGMFGISCQLSMLSLCLVAAVIPGERVENTAEGYFSAHCPADDVCDGLLPSPPPVLPSSLPSPAPTSLFSPLSTSVLSPSPSSLPIPSPSLTVSSGDGSGNFFSTNQRSRLWPRKCYPDNKPHPLSQLHKHDIVGVKGGSKSQTPPPGSDAGRNRFRSFRTLDLRPRRSTARPGDGCRGNEGCSGRSYECHELCDGHAPLCSGDSCTSPRTFLNPRLHLCRDGGPGGSAVRSVPPSYSWTLLSLSSVLVCMSEWAHP
jgi:iron-regulated transporter 1